MFEDPCIIVRFIKKNPTRCNNVSKFYYSIFILAHCVWKRPPTTRPATFHVWKTRGCQCNFRLLIMGGVSPITCWAPDKYGITKILIHCCFLLDFSLWIILWSTDLRTSNSSVVWCHAVCTGKTLSTFRRIVASSSSGSNSSTTSSITINRRYLLQRRQNIP